MSLYQSARKKKAASNLDKRQSFYLPSKPQSHINLQQPLKKAKETVLQDTIYPGKVVTIERGYPGIGSIAVPTRIVRESFHRRAGIRETIHPSGAYKLRTIEIKRNHGESIGFYIRQGDGWKQTNGVFVSRVNLGSVVDINDLLHVGEEIVKVNGVDITEMPLSNVVLLIQKKRNMLRLTVKLPTSEAILKMFSAKHKLPAMQYPTVGPTALTDIPVEIKSTPETEPKKVQNETKNKEIITTPAIAATLKSMLVEAIASVPATESSSMSDESPASSLPPSPPTSPIPELIDSPLPSPPLEICLSLQSIDKHSVADSNRSTSSCSDSLTDSLKDLLDFPSIQNDLSLNKEAYLFSKQSLAPSESACSSVPPTEFLYPLTPPTSDSSWERALSRSSFIKELSLQLQTSLHSCSLSQPPPLPTSLPPSHPPTPPKSQPPTLPTSIPPSHPLTPPKSQPHTSLPPSQPVPPTPPESQPPTPPSTPPPPLPTSPPPSLPTSLPPSHPPTPPLESHPPTPPLESHLPTPPESQPPPLPTSPPPSLSCEPILSPSSKSLIASDDNNDEDIFRMNEIESHLHNWLTQYEISGTDEQTSFSHF